MDVVLVVTAAVVAAAAVVVAVLLVAPARVAVVRTVAAAAPVGMVLGLLAASVGELAHPAAAALTGCWAAALAAVAALFSGRAAATTPGVVAIVVWIVVGVGPIALGLFGRRAAWLVSIGVVDYGGALASVVPLAVLALVAARSGTRLRHVGVSHGALLACAGVAWLGATAWVVGVELRIDAETPGIVLAAASTPLAGAVGWAAVEWLRHERWSRRALASGLLAGVAALLAGAAYLEPVWCVVTGALGGAAAALLGEHRRVPDAGRTLVAALGVGGLAGVVLLGLVARGAGMFYTGSVDLLGLQLLGAVVAVVWPGAIAMLLARAVATARRSVAAD